MAVRSRRIYGPALPGIGPVSLYTVPSGRTLIVRSLVVWNGSSTVDARARVHVNGTSSTERLWDHNVVALDTWVLEEPFILNPGDSIEWRASQTSLRVFIDGSLLFGAPE